MKILKLQPFTDPMTVGDRFEIKHPLLLDFT